MAARSGMVVGGLLLVAAVYAVWVFHLVDGDLRPEDPDLARLGIDPDVDVLVAGNAPVGRLDPVLDGSVSSELLATISDTAIPAPMRLQS